MLFAIIFTVFAAAGNSQVQSGSDVGIDEKLGDTVAMDVPLKDENGGDVTLRELVDRPTILIFNYFRCPGICPVLLSSVVDVVNQMSLEPGQDYRLVALSFDPADTPEMARQEKANYLNRMRRQFPPEAWYFLTGGAEETKRVADSTGYAYSRQSDDMYMHPGALIILTPEGVISRYIYGTSFLQADVTMAVQEAASGQVRPTISRMLAFCYSYDPEGRTYVFSVTRFVGALILVLIVLFMIFVFFSKRKKTAA
jgi:protein SCO1/2